jgi:hypothetical protein
MSIQNQLLAIETAMTSAEAVFVAMKASHEANMLMLGSLKMSLQAQVQALAEPEAKPEAQAMSLFTTPSVSLQEREELFESAAEPETLLKAKPEGKVWAVHDCHTHVKKGIWAAGAVAKGNYGVCVGPSKDSKDTANMKVAGPLGEVVVSKRRWNDAKSISVGDTLFMGDTYTKKVFKGLVTAQPVAGPFCSAEAKEESFICTLGPQTDERLKAEVEVVFKVNWTEVAPLTDEWKKHLGTERRMTVMAIKDAPPA